MSDEGVRLLGLLADQAERVAGVLSQRQGDRSWRRRGRLVLGRAFALAGPAEEAEPHRPSPSLSEIAALLLELDEVRRGLGDLVSRSIRPLRLVRIQRPFPARRLVGRSAALATRLCGDIVDRSTLKLTISDERLAWFEARCEAADPGLLRPIRASHGDGGGQRLLGSELELIRKRGPGRSS